MKKQEWKYFLVYDRECAKGVSTPECIISKQFDFFCGEFYPIFWDF